MQQAAEGRGRQGAGPGPAGERTTQQREREARAKRPDSMWTGGGGSGAGPQRPTARAGGAQIPGGKRDPRGPGRIGGLAHPCPQRPRWARRAACAPATTASTTASWSPSSAPGAARGPPCSTAAASPTSSTAAASRAATFPTSTATCGASGGPGRGPGGRARPPGVNGGYPRPRHPLRSGLSGRTPRAGEGPADELARLGAPGARDPLRADPAGRGSSCGRQRWASAWGSRARRDGAGRARAQRSGRTQCRPVGPARFLGRPAREHCPFRPGTSPRPAALPAEREGTQRRRF